ncbi:MAG: CopD family protein, partial [Anaerolineales bacterium]
ALTQAGQASGVELVPPWSPVVGTVLSNTRYGALWLARLCSMLTLAGLLVRARVNSVRRGLALAVSVLMLLTVSLSSHAAAEPDPWLPVLVDWLHLAAASVWVGGLGHLLFGLWSLRRLKPELRRRTVATLIRRFSALALVSVGVLTLTGVYSAVVQVGSWAALTDTTYGQTLLAKLLIAAPLIALGAFNLLVIRPAMEQRASEILVTRFRRTVTGEVALSVALLLSVGVLTAIPPAENKAQRPVLSGSQGVDDLTVAVEIAPGRIGVNDFSVRVTSNGQPVTDAREVEVQFTPQSGKLPPNKVPFTPQGDGVYAVRGSYFSLPDQWQVRVAVRREGRFDSYAQFNFVVGTNVAPPINWGQLCAVLIAVAGIGLLLIFFARGGWVRVVGIVLALAMVSAAGIVFARPPVQEVAGPVNPIPPNAASTETGKLLYLANCLPCHGPTGKGDGPVGMTLNPRPADLAQHAVPGVHTDGQLYEWVTNGYPGSVMPAFKTNLSDEQRWHLINYLRTFAPQ